MKEEAKECEEEKEVVKETETLGRKDLEDKMFAEVMTLAHKYNDEGLSILLVQGVLQDAADEVSNNQQFENN